MDEIVYQVTRDAVDPEEDGWDIVCLWEPHVNPAFGEHLPSAKGFWTADNISPVETMTAGEFEEQCNVVAPEPGEYIFIATYCEWKKVDFDG